MHDKYGYLSLVAFGAAVHADNGASASASRLLFLSIVDFVLEIIGWVGILGAELP